MGWERRGQVNAVPQFLGFSFAWLLPRRCSATFGIDLRMTIDSSPPHGVSPFGHGTFVPVQTTYKPSVVLLILDF
jgi:hypothetical protein